MSTCGRRTFSPSRIESTSWKSAKINIINYLQMLFKDVFIPADSGHFNFRLIGYTNALSDRGVFRGGASGESNRPCPPIVDWVDFFTEKTGFVGTVLSARSVLWTSNMPKMRWRPRLCPGPRWGSSRLGRGIPLPTLIPTCLGTFGASIQLMCPSPNVKSWLRPCFLILNLLTLIQSKVPRYQT